jgi:hypothetical protein
MLKLALQYNYTIMKSEIHVIPEPYLECFLRGFGSGEAPVWSSAGNTAIGFSILPDASSTFMHFRKASKKHLLAGKVAEEG